MSVAIRISGDHRIGEEIFRLRADNRLDPEVAGKLLAQGLPAFREPDGVSIDDQGGSHIAAQAQAAAGVVARDSNAEVIESVAVQVGRGQRVGEYVSWIAAEEEGRTKTLRLSCDRLRREIDGHSAKAIPAVDDRGHPGPALLARASGQETP